MTNFWKMYALKCMKKGHWLLSKAKSKEEQFINLSPLSYVLLLRLHPACGYFISNLGIDQVDYLAITIYYLYNPIGVHGGGGWSQARVNGKNMWPSLYRSIVKGISEKVCPDMGFEGRHSACIGGGSQGGGA